MGLNRLLFQAANGGVLQINCSAAARKLKLDIMLGKLNYFAKQMKYCQKAWRREILNVLTEQILNFKFKPGRD